MSRGPWKIAPSMAAVLPPRALGIDVGVSAVRAAVVDADGRVRSAARRELTTRLGRGRAEHDPREWLTGTFAVGREAAAGGGGHVDAIGVGALGPAPLLVDADLEPLTPALLFSLDRRAEEQRAAIGVTHDHALPKLLWWREHEPAIWRRAATALDATGFLVARLTGRPTMDAVTRLDYGDAPLELPPPADPLAVSGGLGTDAARELGLAAGTPVATGTYDTYVDVAGVGARKPGDGCILLGSTLVVCRVVDDPVECPGLELSPYPGEGLLLGGWTTTGGSTLSWFTRQLGQQPEVAELEPGAGGLVALPYLCGERTPVRDPHARGLVLGLTLETSFAELYRALVDGVALSARDHAERLRDTALLPDRWLTGGGGTSNEAWVRATADAIGAPLDVVTGAGDAVGAAHLALRSIGVEPTRPVERRVEPDPARTARFDGLYAVYRNLHPQLADPMRRLEELAAT
jgi:xylulokinase